METIKINYHKDRFIEGFVLRVNGMYIGSRQDVLGNTRIHAITGSIGVPYGADHWMSIDDLRAFWRDYRGLIVFATSYPVISYYGRFISKRELDTPQPGETYVIYEDIDNHGNLRKWIDYRMINPYTGEEFSYSLSADLWRCRIEAMEYVRKSREKDYAAEKRYFQNHPELNP